MGLEERHVIQCFRAYSVANCLQIRIVLIRASFGVN